MTEAPSAERTDQRVREFYEAFPYPRQDEDLRPLADGNAVLVGNPRHWFHLYFPDSPYRTGLEVLVAGCGTREAPRIAAGNPECAVTAIDISSSALEATERLKAAHGLGNLTLRQLPLERALELKSEFDLIFCSGVLHHTADPVAGLQALRRVLRRGGSLNAMLYGRYGRLAIEQTQELMRAAGVSAANGGVARARQWIAALPSGHAFRRDMDSLADLAYDEGLADLLLNPRERSYDVAGVAGLVEAAGFRFQRFVCQAHYEPCCSMLAADEELYERSRVLPDVERWGLMELHRGNIRRHVFTACRDDRPMSSTTVNFEGECWRDYVPQLNPGLETAETALPPGARTRIHWANHDYPEISAVLDDNQTALLQSVDQRRTIAQIVEHAFGQAGNPTSGAALPFARDFFESMWRFDYVWFQTGGGGEPPWEPAS